MEKSVGLLYKKKMMGGRSALARVIDTIFLRALILIVVFWVLLVNTRDFTVSVIVSVLVTVAVSAALSLLKKRRQSKYMRKDMQRLKRKCLLETLTMKDTAAYLQYIIDLLGGIDALHQEGACAYGKRNGRPVCVLHNHPEDAVGVGTLLEIFRKYQSEQNITLVSLAGLSDAAKNLTMHAPIALTYISGDDVLSLAEEKGMMPSEAQAQQMMQKEMEAQAVSLKQIRKNALQKSKAKGYAICGAAVTLWPLVSGFRFYHPLISAACFALAIYSYKKGEKSGEPPAKGTSSLDKKDSR